ncbi:MAG: DnaJ domain-containing protein [Lachnospiraceae bacterium]|nr:DnaJ domain-containing protein [Lachnospiraceae bacterium]
MSIKTSREALLLLGLDQGATKDEIKSAYHRMAAYVHPDAGRLEKDKATEAFQRLREAYDFLMDAWDGEAEVPQPSKIVGGQMVSGGAFGSGASASTRTIGGDAAMRAWQQNRFGGSRIVGGHRATSSRDDVLERRKQEKRSEERRRERIRRRDEELRKRAEEEMVDEEMMRVYAIRAAEIAAQILGFGG